MNLQSRTIRIKNTNQMSIDLVVAVVSHYGSLGESLRLVIYRTRSSRIHVSPVGFDLRMNLGIAIALRGRCMKIASVMSPRYIERIQCPRRTHQKRLHSQPSVIHRACGRSEVEDVIYCAYIERLTDILSNKLELRFVSEMSQIGLIS